MDELTIDLLAESKVVGLGVVQLALFRRLQIKDSPTPQNLVRDQATKDTLFPPSDETATTSTATAQVVTNERSRVLVATRVHQANALRLVNLERLEEFVVQALGWGEDFGVAVAVGAEGELGRDLLEGVEALVAKIRADPRWAGRDVRLVAVTPWGKFVNGLNALVQHALTNGYDHLLLASVETLVHAQGIEALRSQMTTGDLVVGAAFADHKFDPLEVGPINYDPLAVAESKHHSGATGSKSASSLRTDPAAAAAAAATNGKWHDLDGATTPWNTLALWHAPTLALTGFVGVAEGLEVASGRSDGGVEEVTAIVLLQHLLSPPTTPPLSSPLGGAAKRSEAATAAAAFPPPPPRVGCKLVRIPGLTWAVSNFEDDPERKQWHARKMASKVSRPAAQLERFSNLPKGRVLHLDLVTSPHAPVAAPSTGDLN